MVYRLTRRSLGRWEDVMEEGEPFDFDTEEEAIDTLNVIHWRNYKGTPMNYRAVSDEELEAEKRRWAMTMAYNM
ncbi:MAG: hypothetical protein II687_03020 [Selenomonadaceae bacterium]|nr:hypothetical protein [Selenomonadaceae bacterium]